MTDDSFAPLLYLDDLQVGHRFASREHSLDERQILDFARQFDPQPFHADPEAAKATSFGGLIASGWLTAALSARLTLEALHVAGGMVGAGGEVAWPRPTRVGDTIHIEGFIASLRPSRSRPERGVAAINVDTLNQNGEVVQNMQVTVVALRRPAA